jgi:nucleotide-binding universal stress UspA family protein
MSLIHCRPIAYADSTMGVPFSDAAHKKACESFAQKILAKSHEKIGTELLVHTMHVQNGNVFEGIIEAAKEAKGDVIVMASNKNTGLKGILLGSETHAVIVHSKLPVLVLG